VWIDKLGIVGLLVALGLVIVGMLCITAVAAVCRKALG
jgi:hypothetical protein